MRARGSWLALRGQYGWALWALEKAQANGEPFEDDALQWLAGLYALAGQKEKAAAIFDKLAAKKDADPKLRLLWDLWIRTLKK